MSEIFEMFPFVVFFVCLVPFFVFSLCGSFKHMHSTEVRPP